MTARSRGHAIIGVLKLVGWGVGGILIALPLMRYSFDQAAISGNADVWIAVGAVVPFVVGFFGWMVRDSGNLRELKGGFDGHKAEANRKLDKTEDAQERIFRELGGAEQFRSLVLQRMDQMEQDRAIQSKLRHEMRNEWSALMGASDLAYTEKIDRLDARIRDLEQKQTRQTVQLEQLLAQGAE